MPGFAGKMGQIPTVRVFREVKPVAMVCVGVEPDPEPTWEFGTVANTTFTSAAEAIICTLVT